jgi:phosphoglycolate phosphatase
MIDLQVRDHRFESLQAVIFDKDGTLAQVESYLASLGQKRARLVDAQVPGVQEPLLLAFGLEGARLSPTGLLAVGSRREGEIAAAAYIAETGKPWVGAVAIAIAAFDEAARYLTPKSPHTPLLPGTLELLQQLAATPAKIGILSADTSAQVEEFVTTYQLNSYIDVYHGIDGLRSKPDPWLFTNLCAALGVDPGHTLMVGDSDADMAMAKAAQAAGCIGVSWGWSQPNPMVKADVIINDPSEIKLLGN